MTERDARIASSGADHGTRSARTVRAVVVDDEPAAREAIVSLLADHPGVEVIGEATNGRDAVTLLRRLRPDLLFLDIQMPDGDGFGVLDALGDDVPRGIIFVTAHDEHALRAFEVHALDYVLKPFGRPRFSAAVSRALERLGAIDASTMKETLASIAEDRRAATSPPGEITTGEDALADDRRPRPRRLGVRTGTHTVVVDIERIDWVESYGDYARVHTGRQTHVVAQRMHALERMLEDREFVRIHRSLIVNLRRVRELNRDADGGGSIVLDTGVRLRVARGRWDALQQALEMEEL